MSRRWVGAGTLALACCLATGAIGQSGGDPGVAVVKRASQAYQGLTSFKADFRQHFEDKVLDIPDGKGTLYQEGKNRFAMRFSDPPHDAVVVDGSRLWLYTPSSSPGQLLRYPIQNHPTYGTNLLGTFLDDAVDRYRVSYLRQEMVENHMTDVVMMEPVANDMPFRRATIWFDRENSMPRRLDIEESPGHKRILQLSGLEINRSIPPSTFICKPPAGTKIIDQ